LRLGEIKRAAHGAPAAPVHKKQLLTYQRLADKRLGLLINFHVALIKDGITRAVNGLEEDITPSRQARQGETDR
jgi:PD-(D/E)XK nuclease superfamily protein